MPDVQPTRHPAEEARQTERDILYYLTNTNDNQPLWSIEDLGRELGDHTAVEDAIHNLRTAGLIHTSDGHVFASRAAVRLIEIVGRVI
jgi:hypothetical protein